MAPIRLLYVAVLLVAAYSFSLQDQVWYRGGGQVAQSVSSAAQASVRGVSIEKPLPAPEAQPVASALVATQNPFLSADMVTQYQYTTELSSIVSALQSLTTIVASHLNTSFTGGSSSGGDFVTKDFITKQVDRIYDQMSDVRSDLTVSTDSIDTDSLEVGDLDITGLLSIDGDAGTAGYVLQTTGTGTAWVATSTLGISGALGAGAIEGGNITHTASGNPTFVGTYDAAGAAAGIAVSGKYAYLAYDNEGLNIIDVSDPSDPIFIASEPTSGQAMDVAVSGKYAYVAGGAGGLRIIDVSNPSAPETVGTYDTSDFARGVSVSGKYVYVAYGGNGLLIIDASDPAQPRLMGTYDSPGTTQDVVVMGMYAFVADHGEGLHIVDISDPTAPTRIGTYDTSGEAQDVSISGRYAYVVNNASGLAIIDISDTSAPTLVDSYVMGDTARGIAVSGRYAYIAADDVHIVDISDPADPTTISSQDSGGQAQAVVLSGKYAYVAAGLGGLRILDINGIETPALSSGSIQTGTLNTTEHAIIGGDIYAQGGLNVGISGIFSRGTIAAYVASSTQPNAVVANFMGGNVGIGTSTPTERLTVSGTIQASNLLGGATNLTTDASGNIIRDPSDGRLKTNVQDLEGSLNKLLGLRGVTYEWEDTERFGTQTEIGFIAQEVDLILPEVVQKGGEYWSLNRSNMVAVVVEAIKELWAIITGHGERLEELEERIRVLEAEQGIVHEEDEDTEETTEETETPALPPVEETEPVIPEESEEVIETPVVPEEEVVDPEPIEDIDDPEPAPEPEVPSDNGTDTVTSTE